MAYLNNAYSVPSFGFQFDNKVKQFRKWARARLLVMQHRRMVHLLSGMNDTILNEIGITRSEIPVYAKTLIYGDKETSNLR